MRDLDVIYDQAAIKGTSLRGEIIGISGADLRKRLGPPLLLEKTSDGKIRWMWIVKTVGGDIITIHDYKSPLALKNIRQWFVGGHRPGVASIIGRALGVDWRST